VPELSLPLVAVVALGDFPELLARTRATTAMTATAPMARAGISGPRDLSAASTPGRWPAPGPGYWSGPYGLAPNGSVPYRGSYCWVPA
jgi:hypothetical protein